MSYTAPSVDASSQTFADLQADGLTAFINGLVAAQDPAMSAAAVLYTSMLGTSGQASQVYDRASQVVSGFLQGDPVLVASLKTEIFDLQYAYAAVAAALGEIGTLVDANQGTITFAPDQLAGRKVRVFS